MKDLDQFSLYLWHAVLADPAITEIADRWCQPMEISRMEFLRLVDGYGFGKRRSWPDIASALNVHSSPKIDRYRNQPSDTSLAGWYFANLRTGDLGMVGADLGEELLVRWATINGNRKTLDQAMTGEHVVVPKELSRVWTFYETYVQRDRALERLQVSKQRTGAA